MTKTKMIVSATVLAAAALYVVVPTVTRAMVKDRSVVVTVDFLPAQRSGCPIRGTDLFDSVAVHIKVGKDVEPLERVCRSPLVRVYYPREGELVEVKANQLYGSKLRCMINQGSTVVAEDEKAGTTWVICRHVTV